MFYRSLLASAALLPVSLQGVSRGPLCCCTLSSGMSRKAVIPQTQAGTLPATHGVALGKSRPPNPRFLPVCGRRSWNSLGAMSLPAAPAECPALYAAFNLQTALRGWDC